MRFFHGNAPKRKSKPKESPIERHEAYLKLRATIASGKMKPQEQAGIYLDPSDAEKLGIKHPARTAAECLRRTLHILSLHFLIVRGNHDVRQGYGRRKPFD
jgi:hypothetical protein